MDIRKVKKLIELLEESGIAELEIKEGEESVRILRHSVSVPVASVVATGAPEAPKPAEAPAIITPKRGVDVKSPMVGTFYAAPSPTAEPFVHVGKEVKKGDTLCIVEAMKIMNPIESEHNGVIISIEQSNGTSVEYGETLFVIEPNS